MAPCSKQASGPGDDVYCGKKVQGGFAGALFLSAYARLEVHLGVHPRSGSSQVLLPGKQRGRAAAIPETQSAACGGLRDGVRNGMSQPRKIPGVARSAIPIDVSGDLAIPRINLQMANDSACHR